MGNYSAGRGGVLRLFTPGFVAVAPDQGDGREVYPLDRSLFLAWRKKISRVQFLGPAPDRRAVKYPAARQS